MNRAACVVLLKRGPSLIMNRAACVVISLVVTFKEMQKHKIMILGSRTRVPYE